ncbi:hypothetical protein PPSIR1_07837 [Plesiocystis pacifica SIR-1]|uniref:Methyltransferase type 11 domain-containing protein n=1 Tax=Plesiocystis pacifica SIR-1 TaxID=391625 RepID=A6GCW2_9BACT|nr:class I SAM-dependent methyltransferase [Plesiocystis pacifica]EDM76286.1 hypothetical protein PPSIR1_07837 [Plesiocystis pacifica SIR-1]
MSPSEVTPPTQPGDFSPQAAAYARARPPYPAAMVARLVERAKLDACAGPVVEIGAGTGLFTKVLVEAGLEVLAVEPNAAMRERAPSWGERVQWSAGTFDDPGLAPASASWVVAAQALHWAEASTALPALHRLLRPGGHLSALWNIRDTERSPLLLATAARIEALTPGFDEGYRARDWPAFLTSTGHFEAPVVDEVPHVLTLDHARFLDLWRSHNKLNAALGPEAMAGLLTELEALLAADFPGPVEVPYRCRAWTAATVP